jgi:acyl transferase domain-containing protein
VTWEAKPTSPVAVVGIDCRFPGAAGKDAFWEMLMGGGHGITEVPAERWDVASFYSGAGEPGTANTMMAGFISDPDVFDHGFFGVSPRAAAEMDPQQRLLLQAGWRAVEDAAIDPTSLAGTRTGVYVGVMSSDWALLHMSDYHDLTAQRGTGNGYHMTANRLSYHLDLKGPSVAVDTACSSSLVALHMAVAALCSGECDLAITAGVNLILTPALSIFYTQAGLSAPDGQCKPFSARADGIGRGEGVGVVVLRRLEDALAHQQPIYAVIDGSAINHDGRSNGITAPNRWSQQQVIGAAYARAGVRPGEIHFVEAHGTGTMLGDMIEIKALGAIHAVDREHPCVLGSVKGNIGHTEGAAGIAGVIKTCLALHRRVVPPSRHSADENTELRLPAHGLRLARAPMPLPADGTLRAGVSSFGLGGTNAHVVLSTPPPTEHPADPGGVGVLTVSADTADALHRNLTGIAEMIGTASQDRITQLCYSTNLVKSSLRHRFALAASNREELLHGLREYVRGARTSPDTQASTPRVVFLFTGQGAQYPRMTGPLYHNCPAYRERFDEVDAAMRPHLGHSIASVVLDGDGVNDGTDDRTVDDTCLSQPALFAVGYALGAALRDLGVRPEAMIGHSIGEYAAACLSGVLTLSEACRVVVARGALMQQLPDRGAMLAVRASIDQVRPHVDGSPSVTIAAYNGPRDVVVSGAADAVADIGAALDQAGVATAPLRVSHAFHSPLMRPIVREFMELVAELPARAPTVPFASTVHGRLLDDEPIDAGYWAVQVTAPVRFDDALHAVRSFTTPTHLIEIGPAPALLGLARRAGFGREVTGLVPCPGERSTGREVAKVLAELYRSGLAPRWQRLYTEEQRVARRLPPYVFGDRGRFWASKTPAAKEPAETAGAAVPDAAPEQVAASPLAQQALAVLAEVGGYATSELPMDAKLLEDLGYDSITLMRLGDRLTEILRPEQATSFTELLLRLETVGDVLSFVATRAETA